MRTRLLLLVAVGGAGTAAAQPKPLPEQLSAERWFSGTWNCQGEAKPGAMGPGGKVADTLHFKMELGGSWLQVHVVIAGGPMKGKEVVDGFSTWDGTQHVRYDFHVGGKVFRLNSAGWEGDKLVFSGETITGDKTSMRHTITRKGENEFDSLFEIDGAEAVHETCKRAGKAPAAKK